MPYLKPTEKCKKVPKEICYFGFKPAVPGSKPLITKWCYDPSDEDISNESADAEEPPELSPLDNVFPPIDLFPATIGANEAVGNEYIDPLDGNINYQNNKLETDPQIDRKDEFYFIGNSKKSNGKQSVVSAPTRRRGKQLSQRIYPRNDVPIVDPDLNILDLLDTVQQDPEGAVKFNQNIINVKRIFNDKQSPFSDEFENVMSSQRLKFNEVRAVKPIKSGRKGRRKKLANEEVKKDSSHIFKFDSIVSKLDKNANKQVIIEKAVAEEGDIRKNSIARVLKHKDSPISQTVIIQNNHKAPQAFGVRNASIKFVAKNAKHTHIESEMNLINTELRIGEDFLFSNSKNAKSKSSLKSQNSY